MTFNSLKTGQVDSASTASLVTQCCDYPRWAGSVSLQPGFLKEPNFLFSELPETNNQTEETGIKQVDSSWPWGGISETALLCASSYNVSEKAGSVSVTVQRTGNLNQYAIVLCRTKQGTASSSSRVSSQPGQQDYVEYAGQVGGWGGLWFSNCQPGLGRGCRLLRCLPSSFYPTSLSIGILPQIVFLCSLPTGLCFSQYSLQWSFNCQRSSCCPASWSLHFA